MTSLDCMTNHGMQNCWNAHLVEAYTVTRCTKQIPSLAAFHLISSHESMVHHSRHGHPIRLNMSHQSWSLVITNSPPHRNQDTQDTSLTSLASFITHHMSPNGKISRIATQVAQVSLLTLPPLLVRKRLVKVQYPVDEWMFQIDIEAEIIINSHCTLYCFAIFQFHWYILILHGTCEKYTP